MERYSHRLFKNTALPYWPSTSVIDERPRYIAGSSNALTSIKGYCERRPGFAAYTADNFAGMTIKRVFTWRRWNSDFYVMLSVEAGGSSRVYKQKVGTDVSFQLLANLSGSEYADYAVANNHVFIGNGGSRVKYDGTTVTEWGMTAPAAAVSTALAGGGSLTAQVGYKYVICWENGTTGHLSSPSPIMTSRVKPTAQNVVVTGNTTADAQVTQVRIFRTTDGGSRYFEHPSSPVTYANWAAAGLTDSAADGTLTTNEAPAKDQNNQVPLGIGLTYFAGRIWLYKNDRLYYSAFEELKRNHGVPEEAYPPDNVYNFGTEITGLTALQDALLVFTAGTIYRITGDTRASFKRDTLARHAGTRNRAAVASTGRIAAWLDSSNIVRTSDGFSIEELSVPIRSDIETITHASANLGFHDDGARRWLLLMDGGSGHLRVFDQDTNMWMPPWALTGATALHSGEVSAGTFKLFLGRNAKPLAMTPAAYVDEGTDYSATLRTSLINITEKPDVNGSIVHVGIERDCNPLGSMGVLTDEDPDTGTYEIVSDIPQSPAISHSRTQGIDLIEEHYKTEPRYARRASVEMTWDAVTSNFKLYALDIAHREGP